MCITLYLGIVIMTASIADGATSCRMNSSRNTLRCLDLKCNTTHMNDLSRCVYKMCFTASVFSHDTVERSDMLEQVEI